MCFLQKQNAIGTTFFLRYSKIFKRFLYDWRPLTLLEIKLNLTELINFGIPMVINNQTFNKNLCKSFYERRLCT